MPTPEQIAAMPVTPGSIVRAHVPFEDKDRGRAWERGGGMKAITVRNPYAWAIATGVKDIENRTRPVSYRGDIAIHAGAAWHRDAGLDQNILALWAHFYGGELDAAYMAPAQFGAVVAIAELHDSHWTTWACCDSEWASTKRGGAHLLLRNARRLETPVPAKGVLGLWNLPADVAAEVERQVTS